MVAHADIIADRCGGCGLTPADAERTVEHYEVGLWRCPVCEARDVMAAEVAEGGGSKHGLHIRWFPKDA